MENFKLNDLSRNFQMPEFLSSRVQDLTLTLNTKSYSQNEASSFETMLHEQINSSVNENKQDEFPEKPAVDNEILSTREKHDTHGHFAGNKPEKDSKPEGIKQDSDAKALTRHAQVQKNPENHKKTEDKDDTVLKISVLNTLIVNLQKIQESGNGKTSGEKISISINNEEKNNSLTLLLKDLKNRLNNDESPVGKEELKKFEALTERFKGLRLTSQNKSEIRHIIEDLEKKRLNLQIGKFSGKTQRNTGILHRIHMNKNETVQSVDNPVQVSKNTDSAVSQLNQMKFSSESFGDTSDNSRGSDFSDKNSQLFRSVSETSRNMIHGNKAEGSLLFRQQINELLEKSKITVKDGNNSSIIMKLFPEKLGSLNVTMGIENGILSGKFLVENEEAKQMLMNDLEFLKTTLENSGINVGSFEVNVRSGRHENHNDKDKPDHKSDYLTDFTEDAVENYSINENDYRSAHLNMII